MRNLYKEASEHGVTELPVFLNWIADRLVYVYGESPNVDFVHALRQKAQLFQDAMNAEAAEAAPANT